MHYVNAVWDLEKRIIGLRLIDVSHSGDNISERIHDVLKEYDSENKTSLLLWTMLLLILLL